MLGRLTALYPQARYLEVGVLEGQTFDQVPATRKVAVDPMFRFDPVEAARTRPGCEYHPVPSDEYFDRIVGADEQFDVIYLDGLHTFEQILRDLLNSLPHLQPRGVIVVDDTRPPTHLSAIPDRQDFLTIKKRTASTDSRWMGDVFRVVYFVETFLPELSFATIANNHGQTVFWRTRRTEVAPRTMAEVARITFDDLALDDSTLRLQPYGAIRRRLRRDLGL